LTLKEAEQSQAGSQENSAVEWDQQDLEMKNEETEMTMMNVIDRGENATATVTTETKTGAVAGRGVVRLRLVEAGVVDVVVLARDDVDEKCKASSGLFLKSSGMERSLILYLTEIHISGVIQLLDKSRWNMVSI